MSAQTVKLGLLGAGRIGRLHAGHLSTCIPSARLMTVADPFEEAARECAQRYAIAAWEHDYRAVLDDPAIEAVIICTPTSTHAHLIEEAALAGKHIFCEKPIAFDLPSIDRALAAVQRAGVRLQIGFNRRFDASYRRVRRAIEGNEIGQPLVLHITSRDPHPPPIDYLRSSGGLFLDMTIHDFDMARYLLGREVEEVFAQASVLVDPAIAEVGDIENALVQLRFVGGVIGVISNSRHAAYGYDQRVELLGSTGMISTDNAYPNTAVIGDAHAMRRDLPLHFFIERYTDSFIAEMRVFVNAILCDEPVAVTGEDGRAAVVIAQAAHRSLIEHRPIRL